MPEKKDGTLTEITPTDRVYRTALDPLTYYVNKMLLGEKKGYRPGWAKHQFQLIFGYFPQFSDEKISIRRIELTWQQQNTL
jgi:hypothetical protein